jgi:hypothetical protein
MGFANDSVAQTPPSSPEATLSTAALLHAECAKMSVPNGMMMDTGLGDHEVLHTPKPQHMLVLTTPPTSPLEAPENLRFEPGPMKSAPLDSAGRLGGKEEVPFFESPADFLGSDAVVFKYDCADWLADM